MCHTKPQKLPENAHNLQIGIVLIINNLSTKTHENTGNKPAKPIGSHSHLAKATEMKNKTNMTSKPQHTHNPHQLNQMHQINQWFRLKPPVIACKPEK